MSTAEGLTGRRMGEMLLRDLSGVGGAYPVTALQADPDHRAVSVLYLRCPRCHRDDDDVLLLLTVLAGGPGNLCGRLPQEALVYPLTDVHTGRSSEKQ